MNAIETIRSTCHTYEPYVSKCFTEWPSGKCKFPGIEAEFNWQMLTILGFNVQFITANSSEEMFHLIANGSADVTCLSKRLTNENFKFGEPTAPICEDYPIFILPDRRRNSMDSNLLLQICHWSVWLTCLTIAMCCFIMGHFTKKMGRPHQNSVNNIVSVSYYMTLSVVLGVCGNFLAVALSTPSATKPIFKNLMEYSHLVATGKCQAILVEQSMDTAVMKNLVNPVNAYISPLVKKNLVRAYAVNPPIIVKTLSKLVKHIKSSSGCLVGIDWHLARPFTEKQFCDLQVYEFHPKKSAYVFYTRKNWPHRKALDALMTKTSMDDLYQRIARKHVSRMFQQPICKDINKGTHGLSIGQMIDTFYILSFTSGLAVIVFCLEKVRHRIKL